MAIYNTAGSQYTAVTGKKRRFPYDALIESQIPSLYQSKKRQEDKEFAESQLSLEEQALEESARASEASLTESIRTSDIQAGLRREEIEAQEKQAKTASLISGAQTAGLGYYGASKLGLFGTKTATTAAGAQTAATGSTVAGSGATAGGAGLSALGYGAGGYMLGKSISGDKSAGEIGAGAGIGFSVGGPVGAGIGAVVGGLAKPAARESLRIGKQITDEAVRAGKKVGKESERIVKQAGSFLGDIAGTWLCTKTKETVGMTDEEWSIIGEFREYAKGHYDNGLAWYVEVGPELIKSINGNAKFYKELKRNFLEPVIGLTRGGYPEIAFSVYKAVVITLAEKWNPSLLKTLPEEYRGDTNTRSS